MVSLFGSSNEESIDDETLNQLHDDLQIIISELRTNNTHMMVQNALLLLESQYNTPDSIMTVEEIKQYYATIANYLFADLNK